MKTVPETYRLLKRQGTYYYVRRVPNHLRSLMGKAVVKYSLGTGVLAEAKKLRTFKELTTDQMFAQLEAQGPGGGDAGPPLAVQIPSISQLTEYVRSALEVNDARLSKALASDPPESADQLREMRIEAETMLAVLNDPDDPRRDEAIHAFKKKSLAKAGSLPGVDLPEFTDVVRRALIELYRRTIDRYDARYGIPFHDQLFGPSEANKATLAELSATYLLEKAEEYAANGVSAKRADKVGAQIAVILEVLGPETKVGSIGDENVKLLRSVLGRLPANKSKLYKGLSIEKVILSAEVDKRRLLSPTTQGFYLDTFRDLLGLAVRRKMLINNPAADAKAIKKHTVSPDQRRLPFTAGQLEAFFKGEFYKSCAPNHAKAYSKNDRAWRFWIPLIMLFSGARPNEIAQLRVGDLKVTEVGTHFFDLIGEGDDDCKIAVKTASSRRRIPIHVELVRMGILSFVEDRKKVGGEAGRLFPSLKPNAYGNVAWYAARRFNENYLPAAMEVGARQSLYSLRHNVRDALRRVHAPAEALQAIAGWTMAGGKAASDHYGDTTNPDNYRAWVDAIAYPGLDLSFLHV